MVNRLFYTFTKTHSFNCMKYIKCKNCNHHNALTSSFLIFCEACGKKLEGNFKDWNKLNSDKTFEDFVLLYGVDKKTGKKSENNFTLKKGLQVFAIAFCVVIAGYYGDKQSTKVLRYFYEIAFPVSDLLDKEWGSQTFENTLTIETPFVFEKNTKEIPIEPEVKKLVKEMDVYDHHHSPTFSIVAMVTEFDESIGKANLKGASDAAIVKIVMEQKGKDLFFNDQEFFVSSYPAILKKATFTVENSVEVHYKGIVILKEDLTIVYLTAMWIGEDESYTLLIDRIIGSMQVY